MIRSFESYHRPFSIRLDGGCSCLVVNSYINKTQAIGETTFPNLCVPSHMAPSKAKNKAKSSTATAAAADEFNNWIWLTVVLYVVYALAKAAYSIRLYAINEYGPVIHEFDPYFNYRATEVSSRTGVKSKSNIRLRCYYYARRIALISTGVSVPSQFSSQLKRSICTGMEQSDSSVGLTICLGIRSADRWELRSTLECNSLLSG